MSKQYIRRDIIALLGGGALVGLAGCLGADGMVEAGSPASTDADASTPVPTPTAEGTPDTTPESTSPEESPASEATVAHWAQRHGTAGNAGFTTAVGPTDGTLGWTSKFDGAVETSPVVFGDRLFVAARETLYSLATADGSRHWSQTFGGPIDYTPACTAEAVLVASDQLYAVSPETGQSLWSSAVGGGPATDVTVYDGVVYFGATDSMVYGLRLSDGKQVARSALFSFGGVQSPAVDDTYVYVAAKKGIVALNRRGAQVWKYETSAPVECAPVVDGETVYVGAVDGSVSGIDRKTGAAQWTTSLSGSIQTPPTLGTAGLFVVAGSTLCRLEPEVGRVEWAQRVDDGTLTSVVQTPTALYVGSFGNRVFALSPKSGAVKWSSQTTYPVVGGPALAGERLYVGTSNGTLYAFE